jgi:ketosteroid isomerase-like protein
MRQSVTLDELDGWLDLYGRAWERQDVEAFVACFTDDAVYCWGPFGEPLRGAEEIRERTTAAVTAQSNIAFRHEPLAVTPDGRGISWWAVAFDVPATDGHVELEGIFLVTLNDECRCTEFREWWNERGVDG